MLSSRVVHDFGVFTLKSGLNKLYFRTFPLIKYPLPLFYFRRIAGRALLPAAFTRQTTMSLTFCSGDALSPRVPRLRLHQILVWIVNGGVFS